MSTSRTVINRTAGDTGADLYTEIEVDLAGASVFYILQREDGARVERAAVIDVTSPGQFHVEWQAGDLVAGEHELDLKIIDGAGAVKTLPTEAPIILNVRRAL